MIKAMPKWRYYLLVAISIFWVVFQLRIKLYKPFRPWFQLPLHMCLALIVVFLMNPLADKYKNKLLWIVDGALCFMSVWIFQYFARNADYLNQRMYSVDPFTGEQIVVAVFLLITILEATRRVVSVALFGVILFFMAYAWFGQFVPGIFHYQGITFDRFCETLMLSENGIFGSPLNTSLNTLFYFLLFGSFFATCGGGAVLIDCGMKLSDKTVGGPAKAAVISSGLMGMISGSAVANVSSTGVFTIPLMKKTGYSPEEAGAIESVASTGGQIMPPIMGAGAFIMAEIIGLQYIHIAASAVIPAIAYFGSAFILVHLLARKRHIGKDSNLHYEGKPVLPRLYRLLPIVVLVVMIIIGYSIPRSAIICTVVSIIVSMISPETRLSLKKLIATILDGIRQAANIAIPTAACGIMIGIVVRSGIAVKISKLIGKTGNSSLLLALLIAAIGCLILGMALPTVAAYLIANTLFISAIQQLLDAQPAMSGLNTALIGNMFIFYFGVVAQITPPVCLASFTAAGIANASAWKTGWKAFMYASVAFIAPFMFVYRPALLLEGSVGGIIVAGSMLILATFCLGAAISGYMFKDLNTVERILFLIVALFYIMPQGFSDILGVVGSIVLLGYCFLIGKKNGSGQSAQAA
ncbi:MAG: TRAP transporter fused permease subunit [Lachnospiraceae bacterium]|nr:TRAP transporter fused permease subunit [Lachnospiraceae bacterium]